VSSTWFPSCLSVFAEIYGTESAGILASHLGQGNGILPDACRRLRAAGLHAYFFVGSHIQAPRHLRAGSGPYSRQCRSPADLAGIETQIGCSGSLYYDVKRLRRISCRQCLRCTPFSAGTERMLAAGPCGFGDLAEGYLVSCRPEGGLHRSPDTTMPRSCQPQCGNGVV
jgi:hypothetical protein